MEKTAEQFLKENNVVGMTDLLTPMMIEFAKLHVEAALKFAAIEATIETINKYSPEEQHIVNHDSILNSYSRKNIK